MKYMIMMFGGVAASMADRSPEWFAGLHALTRELDDELREAGELVGGGRLIDPSRARTVVLRNGAPVATDGPFAEIKESVVGYWLVDATEERAIEVAARMVAYVEHPIEVRQVMDDSLQP